MQAVTQDAPVNGPERPPNWNAVNRQLAAGSAARPQSEAAHQRIFAASQQGDHKRVASLQKLMVRS
jgi:hypothetical protein